VTVILSRYQREQPILAAAVVHLVQALKRMRASDAGYTADIELALKSMQQSSVAMFTNVLISAQHYLANTKRYTEIESKAKAAFTAPLKDPVFGKFVQDALKGNADAVGKFDEIMSKVCSGYYCCAEQVARESVDDLYDDAKVVAYVT
jgi:hypothetical protein